MAYPSTTVMERRRHPRSTKRMKVNAIRLDPDGGDVVDTLETCDISRSGIGAISGRFFYPGQRVIVGVPLTDKNGRRNIYATVIRCRECEGGFHIGFAFDSCSRDNADNMPAAA